MRPLYPSPHTPHAPISYRYRFDEAALVMA